jgi:hypothetical protein
MSRRVTVWEYQDRISTALLAWNALNIVAGLILGRSRKPLNRGIATQNVGWGVINIGIALIGMFVSRRRKAKLIDPYRADILHKERRSLRRLLAINTGLDLLYIAGGSRLLDTLNVYRRGMGFGIMLQGFVLFVWDVLLLAFFPQDSGRG